MPGSVTTDRLAAVQRAHCPVFGGGCSASTDHLGSRLPHGQDRWLWVAVSLTHCHWDGVTTPHSEQGQEQLSAQDCDPHMGLEHVGSESHLSL